MGEIPKGLMQNVVQQKVDWSLTDAVKKRADDYMELHRIDGVTNETFFTGAMFSVLAARQDYANHVKLYAGLLANGYDDPAKLSADRDSLRLRKCMAFASGPNQKRKYLVQLADYWLKSDLPRRIIDDCLDGQKKEFCYRDKLSEEAPGIWMKGASMLFGHIGYHNVVPIDTWMVKFLRDHGHTEFKQPNYRTTSGPRPDQYLLAENVIAEHAEKNGLTPYLCQVALWVTATGWTRASYLDPKVFIAHQQGVLWTPEEIQKLAPNGKIVEPKALTIEETLEHIKNGTLPNHPVDLAKKNRTPPSPSEPSASAAQLSLYS